MDFFLRKNNLTKMLCWGPGIDDVYIHECMIHRRMQAIYGDNKYIKEICAASSSACGWQECTQHT